MISQEYLDTDSIAVTNRRYIFCLCCIAILLFNQFFPKMSRRLFDVIFILWPKLPTHQRRKKETDLTELLIFS